MSSSRESALRAGHATEAGGPVHEMAPVPPVLSNAEIADDVYNSLCEGVCAFDTEDALEITLVLVRKLTGLCVALNQEIALRDSESETAVADANQKTQEQAYEFRAFAPSEIDTPQRKARAKTKAAPRAKARHRKRAARP